MQNEANRIKHGLSFIASTRAQIKDSPINKTQETHIINHERAERDAQK